MGQNELFFGNSDIITFHCYSEKEAVESVLPVFFKEKVGCLHWGLVNGKTQTNLPWGHRPENLPYRGIWQYDLYAYDYKEYSPYEMKLFRAWISKKK